ncbi:MAG: VOC family protein [Opitutaceae bacterium]|jgi:predicted enzyme related to lactoylglutathione lyase
MHTSSINRHLAGVAALAATMVGIGIAPSARAATFPPLNVPASREAHPGKFVWVELFTADSAAATKFYTGVFGWTAVTLVQKEVTYTVFSNGSRPVAGLRQRDPSAAKHISRWVPYIAVADIASAVSTAVKAGGEVRAPAREFPQIGSQAIVTDIEGSPIGLIQSSSGDSPDEEPAPGDWNWFHLLSKSPKASADFYRQVFSYDVAPDSREGKSNELLLSSGSLNRGGISVLPDQEGAKPGWLGVVRVANLDETIARVPALGGEVIVAPHEAALGSRFALISDPTGGTVGVVEYVNNVNPTNRP